MDYDPHVDEFRTLLRSRLTERGSLARLAIESGIASNVIGRWRDGIGRPTDTNLRRLAPALGVPYEELFKMCGYLPGAFPVDHSDDAAMAAGKFVGALRGVPQRFWQSVIDASVALAKAYGEAPAEGAVSQSSVPPVSAPRNRTNKRPERDLPPLGNSKRLPALALGAR